MLALKDRIGRDVEAFAGAFPERRVSFRKCELDDGFVVRRDAYPEAQLTVSLNPDDGSIRAQYLFDSADDLPAPKVLELVPDNEQDFAVHVKENQGQAFRGVEHLSEYLLVPLFTGHPR
jgi:hypothetical protein